MVTTHSVHRSARSKKRSTLPYLRIGSKRVRSRSGRVECRSSRPRYMNAAMSLHLFGVSRSNSRMRWPRREPRSPVYRHRLPPRTWHWPRIRASRRNSSLTTWVRRDELRSWRHCTLTFRERKRELARNLIRSRRMPQKRKLLWRRRMMLRRDKSRSSRPSSALIWSALVNLKGQ